MAKITKLKDHDRCRVQVHRTRPGSAHFAALRCVDCSTHIQWLNRQMAEQIESIIKQTEKTQ